MYVCYEHTYEHQEAGGQIRFASGWETEYRVEQRFNGTGHQCQHIGCNKKAVYWLGPIP